MFSVVSGENQEWWELFKKASVGISSVSEKISAETALIQRWFLALKISVFSAVQSWISAVQRFSGNEQRWNRPESILNQSWSARNVSETSTRVVHVCAGIQQFVLTWTLYFIRLKITLRIHLDTRNPIVFIHFVRIEHGAVSKIPQYHFYTKHINTNNLSSTIVNKSSSLTSIFSVNGVAQRRLIVRMLNQFRQETEVWRDNSDDVFFSINVFFSFELIRYDGNTIRNFEVRHRHFPKCCLRRICRFSYLWMFAQQKPK